MLSKFDMIEKDFFLLISCLYSCFIHYPSSAYYFSYQINLLSNILRHTKYFVLTFFIDVISTLSNISHIYVQQTLRQVMAWSTDRANANTHTHTHTNKICQCVNSLCTNYLSFSHIYEHIHIILEEVVICPIDRSSDKKISFPTMLFGSWCYA